MTSPLVGIDNYRLCTGDARTVLRSLPDESVNSVVTSPPYYNLRSYGTDPQIWGGDSGCFHSFSDEGGKCADCDAWKGELGLEPNPDLFIAHLVEIFREIHRVLRDDGTLFVNIGDSHVHGNRTIKLKGDIPSEGNMFLIPWRLGLALQRDGWILKQDVIWSKSGGNCPRCNYRMEKGSALPEPVRNRFVRAHEYVLFLSKKPKYYFDHVAIQKNGANRRDVLFLTSTPTRSKGKQHYAVMSEHLADVLVSAGTPKTVCSSCGSPWKRVVKSKKESKKDRLSRIKKPTAVAPRHDGGVLQQGIHIGSFPKETIGWSPTCECDGDTTSGIVLDPFSGTATTGAIALRLDRRYIGIDIDAGIKAVAADRLDHELLIKKPEEKMEWLTDDAGRCLAP